MTSFSHTGRLSRHRVRQQRYAAARRVSLRASTAWRVIVRASGSAAADRAYFDRVEAAR